MVPRHATACHGMPGARVAPPAHIAVENMSRWLFHKDRHVTHATTEYGEIKWSLPKSPATQAAAGGDQFRSIVLRV